MNDSNIAYFGYGSLVNLGSIQTPYISAHRATLKGWKRCWLSSPNVASDLAGDEKLAFLSVVADADSEIDGLIVLDHSSSLASLDEREALYARTDIPQTALHFHDDEPEVKNQFLYVADQPIATQQHHILRSYLDVVMQGYLHQFGEEGVHRFVESTLNFGIPIKEDRDNPLYPRATELTDDEERFFTVALK